MPDWYINTMAVAIIALYAVTPYLLYRFLLIEGAPVQRFCQWLDKD